jgi:hypothetical protein
MVNLAISVFDLVAVSIFVFVVSFVASTFWREWQSLKRRSRSRCQRLTRDARKPQTDQQDPGKGLPDSGTVEARRRGGASRPRFPGRHEGEA